MRRYGIIDSVLFVVQTLVGSMTAVLGWQAIFVHGSRLQMLGGLVAIVSGSVFAACASENFIASRHKNKPCLSGYHPAL